MQLDPFHPATQVQVSGAEHSLLVPQGELQIAAINRLLNTIMIEQLY